MNHAAEEFAEAMALPWQIGVALELGACHRNAELARVLRLSLGGAVQKTLLRFAARNGDDGSALVIGPAPAEEVDYAALVSVARRDRPTHLCAAQLRELFDLHADGEPLGRDDRERLLTGGGGGAMLGLDRNRRTAPEAHLREALLSGADGARGAIAGARLRDLRGVSARRSRARARNRIAGTSATEKSGP